MPKISALQSIEHLTTSSILPVVDNNETQKVTLQRVVEFVSASLEPTFATDIELLRSASAITSSLNIFASASTLSVATKLSTASFEAYTASVSIASVNTSSLLLTSSFNSYTSSNDSKVNSLISATGSYIRTSQTASMTVLSSSYATTASYALNATINTGSFTTTSSFNTFTQSYQTDSASFNTRINAATNEQSLTHLVTTSSFNSYTSSNDSKVNSLITKTGSFATTGSNIFIGDTIMSGTLSLSNSDLVFGGVGTHTSYNRGDLVWQDGDGHETARIWNQENANRIQISYTGSYLSGAYGEIITTYNINDYVTQSLTSYATTSSLASLSQSIASTTYRISGSSLTTSSFNAYTSSNDTTNTTQNSRLTSLESNSGSINTFTSSANTALSNVYIATASLNSKTGSYALTSSLPIVTPFLSSSVFQSYTSSNDGKWNTLGGQTGSFLTSIPTGVISGSTQITNFGFATTSSLPVVTPFLSSSTFNAFTTSINSTTSSLNTFTASLNGAISSSTQITNLGFATTSSVINVNTSSLLLTSSFNTFATSSNTFTASVNTATASLNTFSSSVNTFTSSANTALNNVYTATASLNTFTSSYTTTSSSFDSRINSIVNGSGFATTSSFNSLSASFNSYSSSINTFTASINSTTASLNGKTGSYATTGSNQFKADQAITGSLTVTALTTISSSISANSSSLYLTSGSNLIVQNGGLVEISGSLTVSGSNNINLVSPVLQIGTGSGDEGGELLLAKAVTNTTLTGSGVTVDVYRDRLRLFEQGGDARGVYIDLAKTPSGVAGELMWKASGIVNAGTFVTLDNIKAQVTASGNRGLSLATVSGTVTGYISGHYQGILSSSAGTSSTTSLSTTATTSMFGWNFGQQGDMSTYILRDDTNSRVYRIILIIGSAYNNNFISIERLY